eukprot:gene35254-5394_t
MCRWGPGLPVAIECDPGVVPLNPRSPVSFETPLFRGRMYLAVRECPHTPTNPWGPGERFAPKRRKIVLTVQGCFKERLRMDTVQTGYEFAHPLRNLPWGISKAEGLIRIMGGPGTASDLCSKTRPYLLNLLCCGTDDQHDLTTSICPERSNWPNVKARQRALGGQQQAGNHYYEVGPTYTFDFYGDKICLTSFSAIIPPLPFLAKTLQGDYLWNFECWHAVLLAAVPEGMIEGDPGTVPADRRSAGDGSQSGDGPVSGD